MIRMRVDASLWDVTVFLKGTHLVRIVPVAGQ